jgi:hypothetical protein
MVDVTRDTAFDPPHGDAGTPPFESPARRIAAFALIALPALALPLAAQTPATPAKPAKSSKPAGDTPDAMVDRWFTADGRTEDGRADRAALLAEMDAAVGPLAPGDVVEWSKKVLARAKLGTRLDKSSGEHWLWPEDKRGKYVLGGELKRPRGLYVGLHDIGHPDKGGLTDSGTAAWACTGTAPYLTNLKWLGLFPQAPTAGPSCWTDPGSEDFVVELIDDALRTWDIDRDRVAMGGFGAGGRGAWMLGAHHADVLSALAPSSGGPDAVNSPDGQPSDIVPGVLPNLRNVHLFVLQISDDPQWASPSNVAALAALDPGRQRWGGYDVHSEGLTRLRDDEPKGGKQAWYELLASKAREARPTRLVWQPVAGAPRQFGWLDWPTPVPGALVQADATSHANLVQVTCDKPAGDLAVLLDSRLVDTSREVAIELNGMEVFRGVPVARLSTLVFTCARGDPELMFACRVPLAPPAPAK